MEITGLKVFLLNPDLKVSWGTEWGKNTILVKTYMDEGIGGLGEAFGTGKAKTTEATLYEFERWLKGKDPTEVLRNWQALYRGARYPLGTATMAALSAVEQALWDISGKACGRPVYKMLGGPTRDRIRLYASGLLVHRGVQVSDDSEWPSIVEGARLIVDQGFTAMKFSPQPPNFASLSSYDVLQQSVQQVRTIREAVGPGVDIGLDYHGRSFSVTQAIKLAQQIEDCDIFFLEEPTLTETPDDLAEIKQKTTIPIAAGERCITRGRLREILEKRAVHILQPEPTANGGILETVKWAAMCETYHVSIAPHQACSPVSLLVCAHIDASISNFLIQEFNTDLSSPMFKDIFDELPRVEDGYLHLPERPGLGIELNEQVAADYPYRPYDRPVIIQPDGGIGQE